MRKLTAIIAVAALAVSFAGISAFACDKTSASASCSSSKTTAKANSTDTEATFASADKSCFLSTGKFAVASIKVDGMTCGGCEAGLTKRLNDVSGMVWVANVSSADGSAKIVYDRSLAKDADFVNAINDKKYTAEIMPAVAITTTDAKKTDTKSGKTCDYSAKTDGESASKTSAKGHASCSSSKGTTSATTASAKGSCEEVCSKLTKAEKDAFCEMFCKIETDVKKSDS